MEYKYSTQNKHQLHWLYSFFTSLIAILCINLCAVLFVDPFFHYHKPFTELFYYDLGIEYQRYYNAGIIKKFDYDSMIIGTSLTEFFRPTEVQIYLPGNYIKTPFSGAGWTEINDNITLACSTHNVRRVIRTLDMSDVFFEVEDYRNETYPSYLYDVNPVNDVYYVINKDTLFAAIEVIVNTLRHEKPGITSFDDYCNWDSVVFSKENSLSNYVDYHNPIPSTLFTEEEEDRLRKNVRKNVINTAEQHPETTFYYYIPPYSVMVWGNLYKNGDLLKRIGLERILIEEVLKEPNIKLFSYANHTDWATNLDYFYDGIHYSPEINTMILQSMKEETDLITADNYEDYLREEEAFYSSYPYETIFEDAS